MQNGIVFLRLTKMSIRRLSDQTLLDLKGECQAEADRRLKNDSENTPIR